LLSNLSFLVSNRSTRQSNTFCVPFQSTNYGQNSFINRVMESVNLFHIDLFSSIT
ncbi:Reverse transcriptase domain-containing protein, partial [Aphis craccivora]